MLLLIDDEGYDNGTDIGGSYEHDNDDDVSDDDISMMVFCCCLNKDESERVK